MVLPLQNPAQWQVGTARRENLGRQSGLHLDSVLRTRRHSSVQSEMVKGTHKLPDS
jgi:hypothetical protein